MKAFLASYSKQIEIAFLLALLVGMDFLKINDPDLKYTLMTLLGALTGFRGAAAGFSGLASLIGGGAQPAPAAPVTTVTVSNQGVTPIMPATPPGAQQ